MTTRERKLRIENHPDKWGGDHSRMDKVFDVMKRTSSMSVRRVCKVCGVRVNRAEYCQLHYRTAQRKLIDVWAMSAAFVLLATSSFAQRGEGVLLTTTTRALSFPAPAPAPFKQTVLTWDNPVGASNRVAWGGARYSWTNSATVATNRFNVTNGICYAITSIVNGIESIPALWPSNRIGEIWLRGMGTNFTGGTNIQKLCSFTNQPPGNMQLWGVANITTGWE